ncbi:MAG TPA: ABC transporter ATP-binding protein [Stellaceae bacterium]|nr:ABC transporter ATP-binding protein [Stellaceae bacterium]
MSRTDAPMTELMKGPVVELRAVSKTYVVGAVAVPALKKISFAIPRQRFSVIVGPSGSGKTTLLNLIGCLDSASEGSIAIAGQDVGALDDNAISDFRAQNVGFIFQNFSLVPVLTAYENVEYPLLLLGVAAGERRDRTAAIIEAVGLADRAKQRPNQLSGGQRQRVAIARALVKEPAFVLADEPTANLDSATGAAIIDLMRRMQQEYATTFVFSTHDPQLMSHADETFRIRDGALIEHVTRGDAR